MTTQAAIPQAFGDDVVQLRRDFHANPELAFLEHRTASVVSARLRALGYEVHEGIGRTGVVGVLRGPREGRGIMLRADMDALPIIEETSTPYRSLNEGVMHACGHDGHVAILLVAAALAAERRDELCGTLHLVFQPAEEGAGGARVMIEDGLFERFAIERAYGLHLSSRYPAGRLGFRAGPMYASSDSFEIDFRGVGGHGAAPHEAVDPVYIAAQFVTSVQQIVSRQVDPLEPAVVTVGAIAGGTIHNVIPRTCRVLGTVRAFSDDVRDAMPKRLERIARACCDAAGAGYDFSFLRRYPVTRNDATQTAYVEALARSVFGDERVFEANKLMGAEDFSFYADQVPSCFYTLGSSGGEQSAHPHHSSSFDIDESCLPTGVAMMAALALDAGRNAP